MIFISLIILIVAMALFSEHNIHFNRISAIILFYAGVLSFNALYIQSIGSGIGIYSGLFQITVISQFFDLFLYFIGALILFAWPLYKNIMKYNNNYENFIYKNYNNISNYITEYSLIILFSILGASFLVSSADLVSMYLSIELQSFGVYILASLYRNSESATSAGLKYFLLGGKCTWETLLKSPIKLSNSGETLKLIVLNYIRKVISGWSNYSYKVTTYKINENKMGYRGSKLDFKSIKEKRVNGSWWNKPFYLKYTLMGCENNYQLNNLSKQLILNKKFYSTVNNLSNINP